jgi:bifunctional DNA-binding transcriptional regulator/antitoxin component of YhaV-PrlF toxin-antitoxin module
METYEGDPQDFTPGDSRKGDEHLAIRFFRKAARDDVASAADGVMRFKEVDMIQIMVPGDRDNIIVRPAGAGDIRRFSKQYEDWKRNETSEQLNGTPLELWGKASLAQIEEYRYIGVRTIEQLGALSDAACMKLPGALEMKRKAQAFLEVQKDEAPLRKVQAELEQRDQVIAEMAARLNALEGAQQAKQPQNTNQRR